MQKTKEMNINMNLNEEDKDGKNIGLKKYLKEAKDADRRYVVETGNGYDQIPIHVKAIAIDGEVAIIGEGLLDARDFVAPTEEEPLRTNAFSDAGFVHVERIKDW